jgi:hypothetical protein
MIILTFPLRLAVFAVKNNQIKRTSQLNATNENAEKNFTVIS